MWQSKRVLYCTHAGVVLATLVAPLLVPSLQWIQVSFFLFGYSYLLAVTDRSVRYQISRKKRKYQYSLISLMVRMHCSFLSFFAPRLKSILFWIPPVVISGTILLFWGIKEMTPLPTFFGAVSAHLIGKFAVKVFR